MRDDDSIGALLVLTVLTGFIIWGAFMGKFEPNNDIKQDGVDAFIRTKLNETPIIYDKQTDTITTDYLLYVRNNNDTISVHVIGINIH